MNDFIQNSLLFYCAIMITRVYYQTIKTNNMKETLEEAAKRLYPLRKTFLERFKDLEQKIFIEGAKWQQEQDKNKYSEEEVIKILYQFHYDLVNSNFDKKEEWFEQFKKK